MKAVRWHARDDVRLDEVPVPVPGRGEVLLRVEGAGICGTDVDEVRLGPTNVPVEPHPVSGRSAPITLGHENVGIVVEADPGIDLGVGTRVVPWPVGPCGRCRECATGHASRCRAASALGMSVDGGMADFMVVAASACVPLDPAIPLERAVLVEPFAVTLHAAHGVDVAGRRVAVVGLGSLGLCMVEVAARAGADAVVAVGRSEARREVAQKAGATEPATPENAAAVDAEIVFETGGSARSVAAALAAVRPGGRVVVLGGSVRPLPLDLHDVIVREIAIVGSVGHDFEDFVEAAAAVEAGSLGRVPREVELAPLEAGPALLRTSGTGTKRILVPGLP